MHKRNILRSTEGLNVIDPLGIIGPKEFEFTIPFIIELRNKSGKDARDKYLEMLDYFSKYCDRNRLEAAVFFTWVYKAEEYVFAKNDDYKMLDEAIKALEDAMFEGESLTEERASQFMHNILGE